jgi:hypothetical protein
MKDLYTKPWAPWFRTLFAHVLAMFAPTLDTRKMVAKCENEFRLEDTVPLTPIEWARLRGHVQAFSDFLKHSTSPDWISARESCAEMAASIAQMFPTDKLNFEELKTYHREFAYAYVRTIHEDGSPHGATDATQLYFNILIHSMGWLVEGKPRSIAEFNRRMFRAYNRPAPRTALEKLQREDEIKAREKRLQQVCDRIGLHLKPSVRKFRRRKIL